MRAVLLLLILVVVVAIGAVATGFIDINQVRPARAPDVDATGRGLEASGGQTPKFEVDTGQIAVGSREATVKVPAIQVRPADATGQQPTGQATPPAQQTPPAQPNQPATTDATQR